MRGRVAVYTAPRKPFEFREYPVADPAADGILVKMRSCNICGSELHLWRGQAVKLAEGLPQILGHEMVGTVERLGRSVTCDSLGNPLTEGDRIVYTYGRPCGQCWYCLSREASCPNRHQHWIGVSSDTPPHFNGGFGEFYYVCPHQAVFRVPDELSDDLVSPVNCAAAQLFDGLRHIEVRSGDTVLIQGAGGLGLYSIAMARELGAAHIIVLDAHLQRLELAERFGADRLLNVQTTSAEQRRAQLLEWTDGRGADVALELTGVAAAISEGVELLRDGGRYLWVGNVNKGSQTAFDPSLVVRKALTVRGSFAYDPSAIPGALQFLRRTKDRYPFELILSHHFRFDDINDAFAVADRGEAIRVAIDFP